MVIPDFMLICEIMLVAEGFIDARLLARKFISLYTLCKELLSKQVHYFCEPYSLNVPVLVHCSHYPDPSGKSQYRARLFLKAAVLVFCSFLIKGLYWGELGGWREDSGERGVPTVCDCPVLSVLNHFNFLYNYFICLMKSALHFQPEWKALYK